MQRHLDEPLDRHFDQTVQRYMPEDCTVFGWLEIDPILHSDIGRRLTSVGADFKACDERFAPFDLAANQIERIVFAGRSLEDEGLSEYIAIVFCDRSMPIKQWKPTVENAAWSPVEVGKQRIWLKKDEAWAVCAINDHILLAGTPNELGQVLSRNGLAHLPDSLDRVRRDLNSTAALAMAFLAKDSGNQLNSLASAFGGDLTRRVDAVSVQADFAAELKARMTMFCDNEASALQLKNIGAGLLAMVQLQGLSDQEPEVRRWLQSIELNSDGAQVTATMNVPSEMVIVENEGIDHFAKSAPWQLLPFAATPLTTTTPTPGVFVNPARPATSVPAASVPAYSAAGAQYGQPATPRLTPPPTISLSHYSGSRPATYNPSPSYGRYPVDQPMPVHSRRILSIADVIRLVKSDVDSTVIVRHIHTHCLATPLTADDLILLTESGAEVTVISALQELPIHSRGPAASGAVPGEYITPANPYAG